MYEERVVSGMRPTGAMHLGHFHGALKNWVKLQSEYPCLYFVADWHALTTHYETPEVIEESVWDMVIDWLAAGIDPAEGTLFVPCRIPEPAGKKLGSRKAKVVMELRTRYQEQGDAEALAAARALLDKQGNLSVADQERLFGFLEGGGRMILVEPEALLTEASKLPGVDGQKMSKSYDNTISLREDAESLKKKIRTMPTDPARVKRSDPGDPDKCPVWQFHLVYSDEKTRQWANQDCRTAGIGCLECKQPVIDAVLAEQGPMRERAQKYLDDPTLVRNIVADGCEKARKLARETMREVRGAMGLAYT